MFFLSVPEDNDESMEEKQVKHKRNMDSEIERLVDTYGNDVLRTSYMYLKDMQKAEDAFQEVFYKIYRKFGSFRGESSEKTWIIRITINVCKDILRSSWLKRVFITDKAGNEGIVANVESSVIEKDENRRLFDEVTSLPRSYKEVIILYYYHELDTVEISRTLKIAEGTVRSRLHRGREMLRRKMEGGIVRDG